MARICVLIILLLCGVWKSSSEVPARDPVLIWAAEHNLMGIAQKLLEKGVNVNQRDHFGNTPLHKAVRYPEMVRLLLDHGALVNARNLMGETPLHLAVPYKDSVELLLSKGADKRLKTVAGRTPIDYCMDQGTHSYNQQVMEILLR
ncbi:MAG: ankyrin repeat domain-containing protein [Spirochaetes bacterium]|nr:ankyrin repeat domain-containing protein [Spirochaetota bacterium]